MSNASKHPHVFNRKILYWSYCSGCGMVLLNNEVSRKKARKQCEGLE